ncbi:UDP-glucose dehydrogenase family protein [Streptomyces avidinii]|uniref:UDP-glucose dehydrogenase family protein n=1 Tax=Streptomyces avidinii TaxID=1895 RepID=UPI003796DCA3
MKITVIGTGRLGLPYAAGLAELGHDVLGVETNPSTVALLREGRSPFREAELQETITRNVDAGRLRFTDDYDEAVDHGELHFLAVGTPQQEHATAADLSDVEEALTGLVKRLRQDTVIIGKSSVPVGTAAHMAELSAQAAPEGVRIRLGWCPDFMRVFNSMKSTLNPTRLVLGVQDDTDGVVERAARQAWAPFLEAGVPLVVTDFATAEIVKGAANAFLTTKMSFMNSVAEVAEAAGADLSALAEAIGLDPRIGTFGLTPGLGYGGSCLGKDTRAFIARAHELGMGHHTRLLQEVDSINTFRRTRIVDHARAAVGGSLSDARIAVWGAAYRPGVDDISDSPALDVAARLCRAGARVRVYDPAAMDRARGAQPELEFASGALDAVSSAELLLVLTDWQEFADADPAEVARHVAEKRVIDTRFCLPAAAWQAAGWDFSRGFGEI